MRSVRRRGYPSDVTDEEWEFVLPYLLLCREDSVHREHDLREVCNAVAYGAKTGWPGSWVHGEQRRQSGSEGGDRPGSGQAPRGQGGLGGVPPPLGRRTLLRLGCPLPPTGTRLRTARNHPQRTPLHRLRHPHVRQTAPMRTYNFITASRIKWRPK